MQRRFILILPVLFLLIASVSALWGSTTGNAVAEIPSSGLVAYYSGDGNTNDSSEHATNGNWVGNESYSTGKVGQAFNLDKTNIVSFPESDSWNFKGDDFTISIWAKPSSTPFDSAIIRSGADQEYPATSWIVYADGKRYDFGVSSTGSSWSSIDSSLKSDGWAIDCGDLEVGQWTNIIITRKDSVITCYQDGAVYNSGTFNGSIYGSTKKMSIGRWWRADTFFNGLIDEVRVYNRALSENEVQSLYLAEGGGEIGYKCRDSDNGADYNTKGTVKDSRESPSEMTDLCYDSEQVFEYVCEDSGYSSHLYTCPNGCYDGACKSSVNIDSGISAYYKADGNALDSSSSGNNGNWVGNESYSTGKVGQAFNFNGANSISANKSLSSNQNWAISAWVKASSTEQNAANIVYIGTDGSGYGIAIWDGEFAALLGMVTWVKSGKAVDTNWHYITITRDSSVTSIYVDGIKTSGSSSAAPRNPSNYFAIGQQPLNGRYFNGLVDEVVIYNRPLIASEIQYLYSQSIGEINNPVSNISTTNITINEQNNSGWTGSACANSCPLNGKCYPYGYRKDGNYCSPENDTFVVQRAGGEFCENLFECESNACINDKCVSSSLIERFMQWLNNLFGA